MLSLVVSKCAFAVYSDTIKTTEAPASDPAYTYGSIGEIAFKIPKKYQYFIFGTSYVGETWARDVTKSAPGTKNDQIEQFTLTLHKKTLEPCCDATQPEKVKAFLQEISNPKDAYTTSDSRNWFTAIVNRSYSEKPATNEDPKKYFKRRVDKHIQDKKNRDEKFYSTKYTFNDPINKSGKNHLGLNYYLSPYVSDENFFKLKNENPSRGVQIGSIFYNDEYTTFIQCANRYEKTPQLTHCSQTEYWPELNVSARIEYLYDDLPNWQRYRSHIKTLLQSFVIPKSTPSIQDNKKDVK